MNRIQGPDFQDGNVLAGSFREIFTTDITAATGTCAGCGTTGPVAELRVYAHAPGMVARCPHCDEVILRVVRAPNAAWLDLRGTTALRIPLPEE
ncbi:DUF6510 family protein [Streptomyces sp. NPDC006923]|uniref:DUF6510 family protein n=1 Tax=Streptomyces sp. NPDC006923 TaxID=3155355 RepID=UPI00340BFAC0